MTTVFEEIIDGYRVRRYPSGAIERVLITTDLAPEATQLPPLRTLTHKQFRDLLTINEQLLLDNFTVDEYAAVEPKIQVLTLMQRAFVRTAIATYREAQDVDLDNESTMQLVTLFGTLGLWDGPLRAAEILAGNGA